MAHGFYPIKNGTFPLCLPYSGSMSLGWAGRRKPCQCQGHCCYYQPSRVVKHVAKFSECNCGDFMFWCQLRSWSLHPMERFRVATWQWAVINERRALYTFLRCISVTPLSDIGHGPLLHQQYKLLALANNGVGRAHVFSPLGNLDEKGLLLTSGVRSWQLGSIQMEDLRPIWGFTVALVAVDYTAISK